MHTILVPIDFSDVTQAVVQQAMDHARAFAARIVLLHVEPAEPDFVGYAPGPQTVRDGVARGIRKDHQLLDAIEDSLKKQGFDVSAFLLQGHTSDTIIEEARRTDARVIVLGSHGHGAMHHLLLGSVSEAIVRHAPCPVLIVPAKQHVKRETQDGA